MGRFQPKAHPKWWSKKDDKTWLYLIIALAVIGLVYIMIRF